MVYSRRLRVEQKRDRRNTVLYVFFSIASLIILFKFGLPYAVRLIGFVGDFKNASEAPASDDKTPPPPPNLEVLPRATKESNIEIAGGTEAGVTVILTLNGTKSEVLANNEGRFLYEFNLSDGENTISATAKDKAGNESVQTTTVRVVKDTESPDLEVTEPADGASFFGSKQKQVTIKGKTEEGAKVKVNDRWVIVNSDGSFSYSYGLNDGDNQLTVTSEDEAGNKTEKMITVKYSS